MKLFIDSADVEKIREAWGWGIIDGVTTNPSHVAKTGRKWGEVIQDILAVVDGPISLEVTTTEALACARSITPTTTRPLSSIPTGTVSRRSVTRRRKL